MTVETHDMTLPNIPLCYIAYFEPFKEALEEQQIYREASLSA